MPFLSLKGSESLLGVVMKPILALFLMVPDTLRELTCSPWFNLTREREDEGPLIRLKLLLKELMPADMFKRLRHIVRLVMYEFCMPCMNWFCTSRFTTSVISNRLFFSDKSVRILTNLVLFYFR